MYEKAWDVGTGALLPSFPQRQDGFPFYDAPITADIGAGGCTRNAIEANDNYFIHAWGPTGVEAPGFPKYTGQWSGFVGAVADPHLDGQLQLAYGTREGDLFLWNVSGSSALNNSFQNATCSCARFLLRDPSTRVPVETIHVFPRL